MTPPLDRRVSRREALRLAAAGSAGFLVACNNRDGGNPEARHVPASTPSEAERAATQIVRQVDHILLRVDDADSAFAMLTEELRIPVAWPLFTYRGLQSAAASFGGVSLEVLLVESNI